jgi:hypothetical protein
MAITRGKVRTMRGFAEINRDAAGIDVGNAQHWVAVPSGRDAESVRIACTKLQRDLGHSLPSRRIF